MTDAALPSDIAQMSFEDALAELEQIVKRLERGEAKLDEAIQSYERGALLRQRCDALLDDAQRRVDRISKAADGTVTAEPARL
jgi:exodeoxyribonuclease VII small subunit